MASGPASVCLQQLEVQKRTEGDGMENTETSISNEVLVSPNNYTKESSSKSNLIDRLIYRPKEITEVPLSQPTNTGQIVHLFPKNVTPVRKEGRFNNVLNGKEPKFVPYEPYKAAVKPIVPFKKHRRKKSIKITDVHLKPKESLLTEKDNQDQNCSDINSIVKVSDTSISDDGDKSVPDFEAERKSMEEELKRLQEENEQLESQLKFQAQVNGELKNLLVAAMGEDLETRVHLLTEDKLQLARALLNSAQKLSTHQEQTEYLAGQCEVWRSKFLASSLMVEDLAKWKAALCQKATELQETMKLILEERKNARENLISAHNELSVLCDKFDLTALKGGRKQSGLKSSNIVDLASLIQKLSLNLRLQFLGDNPGSCNISDFKGLETTTHAERLAEQLVLHPLALLDQSDAACSAVLGAAVALGAGQLHGKPSPACCSHCSGEIKLI